MRGAALGVLLCLPPLHPASAQAAVGNSPCSPSAEGFSPQQGLGPDQQTSKMGPFLPHSELRVNFLFWWQNPPWRERAVGTLLWLPQGQGCSGDKYLPRDLLVRGPGGQNPVIVIPQLLAHSASKDPNLSQLIQAPPLLRAGLLCTHLLPGGAVGGHSGWEQQVPAPLTASSPRFTGSLCPLSSADRRTTSPVSQEAARC